MLDLYIQYGPAVLAAIFLGFAWLYRTILSDKIKNDRVGEMIAATGQELSAVITEVNNTYVKALKDTEQDGEWDDAARAEAKQKAVDKFKENWGTEGIRRMAKVLGIGGAIDSWLGTQIEASLADMKSVELLPKLQALPRLT